MERYFLGNNSGYGFWNEYESELKGLDKVALIKGGSGTGKSSLMKKIASKAIEAGYDVEAWHCSGDPKSLDGVYIKELDRAVVDATAPHASGVDLPVLKDFIFDVAVGLDKRKLEGMRDEIEKMQKCKKMHFMRAYQHLKSALYHYGNVLELEKQYVDERKIRRVAGDVAALIRSLESGGQRQRTLFSRAISPSGENVFSDHLNGKRVYRVKGCEYAVNAFFDELFKLEKGTYFRRPLAPDVFEGFVKGDTAVVASECAGEFDGEIVDLCFGDNFDRSDVQDERNDVIVQTALAVERLNKARAQHLLLEEVFVRAMDFDKNQIVLEDIESFLFER